MEIESLKKATKLYKEIEELKLYGELVRKSSGTHFEIVEHYGENHQKIKIDPRHNERLIKEIEKIISELEFELKNL